MDAFFARCRSAVREAEIRRLAVQRDLALEVLGLLMGFALGNPAELLLLLVPQLDDAEGGGEPGHASPGGLRDAWLEDCCELLCSVAAEDLEAGEAADRQVLRLLVLVLQCDPNSGAAHTALARLARRALEAAGDAARARELAAEALAFNVANLEVWSLLRDLARALVQAGDWTAGREVAEWMLSWSLGEEAGAAAVCAVGRDLLLGDAAAPARGQRPRPPLRPRPRPQAEGPAPRR
ncbi:MAG: hypothetical protein AAFU61_17475, partial [Pseudomonadota bacterium]